MGVVFGKTNVAEPAFEVLYKYPSSWTAPTSIPLASYEIRRYGQRFAAQVCYSSVSSSSGENDSDPDQTPFRLLARYIGVFGTPENEGQMAIAMTAPVVKSSSRSGGEGKREREGNEPVKIAMTAPVIKKQQQQQQQQPSSQSDVTESTTQRRTMSFILPAEYNSWSQIPKPTNSAIEIVELPPVLGVVHEYSGSYSDNLSREKAQTLADQLRTHGLEKFTQEYALLQYQFWGYNPPFTLPMFRRNEIWFELSQDEVDILMNQQPQQQQQQQENEQAPKN